MQHQCQKANVDKALRLPIQDVYKISGIGTVPVGKIETGTLNVGKTVVFNPSQRSPLKSSLSRCTTQWSTAEPGDNVGFNVRGLAATTSAVVTLLVTLTASQHLFDMTRPSSVRFNLWTFQRQFQLVTHRFSTHTPLRLQLSFMELLEKTNKSGKEANLSFLKTGDACLIPFPANQANGY